MSSYKTVHELLRLTQPKLHMMSRIQTLVSFHSRPVVLGPGRLKARQGPFSGLQLGREPELEPLR
jgi:hypothetical protein